MPLSERLPPVHVVVVNREQSTRDVCHEVAQSTGCRISLAASGNEALEVLQREHVDVLLADLGLAGLNGDFLAKARSYCADAKLVVGGSQDSGSAVTVVKPHAADCLTEPLNHEGLKLRLDHLVEMVALEKENALPGEPMTTSEGFGELVGLTPAMRHLYRMILLVSQGDYPVLILGENGTGKELVARAIQQSGPRRHSPCVPVDCGALAPSLIESELFGHVRGAFTGATHSAMGLLQAAHEGIILLDEIADLPLHLQAKLLRVIQEREVRPLGSTRPVKFQARIIAATSRDLGAAIRNGEFRMDLYFRLNVVTLTVPPLRDRAADIPLLADHFLKRFSKDKLGRPSLPPEAIARLKAHTWPGNVRELQNCMQRAVALGTGAMLGPACLAPTLRNQDLTTAYATDEQVTKLSDLQRKAVLQAIIQARGNRSEAAHMLGIGKSTLYRKLKEYGMNSA